MNNDFKMVLYTTGCPLCKTAKTILTANNLAVDYIEDMSAIQYVAALSGIMFLPILEYEDKKYLGGNDAINYLKKVIK